MERFFRYRPSQFRRGLKHKRVLPYENKELEPDCLSVGEFNRYIFQYLIHATKLGLKLGITTKFKTDFKFCASTQDGTFAIDFDGNVYKCVEMYSRDTLVGHINDNGDYIKEKITSNCLHETLDIFEDVKCLKCNILPYCMGGCPSKQINKEEFCADELNDIELYLKAYSRYYKENS